MQQIRHIRQCACSKWLLKSCYLVVIIVILSFFVEESRADIRSPFTELPASGGQFGAESKKIKADKAFVCSKVPAAVKNLLFVSIYDENDKTRSRVDDERQAAYKERIRPLADFENRLSHMTNLYVRGHKKNEAIAVCAAKWLDKWAKNGALLGESNEMGEAVRKWSLAAISSSYAHVMRDPAISSKQKIRIKKWLKEVARQVISDYSRNQQYNSRKNNHLYWAAWSVALTSYVLDDTAMFNWAMQKAAEGVAHIQPDGTLPIEMQRGQRALFYHIFALAPLIMMAEMGRRNGIDLYAQNDRALHRLVSMVLSGMDDPSYFQKISGEMQDFEGINDPNGLAWLQIYSYRFSSKQVDRVLSGIKGETMINRRLGGDMRLIFPSNYPSSD